MRKAAVRRWGAATVPIAAALAALAGGCGGGASAAADGGATVARACADYATKACNAAQTCEPGVVQYFYPDGLAGCIATSQLGCEASIGAPRSGATAALFEQCGSALAGMTCTQYLSGTSDPSCLPHGGSIPAGGSCGDPWQCASGRCGEAASAGCGVCLAQVALGATCTGSECADGLVCSAAAPGSTSSVCQQPVALGQPCFDSSVCPGNSICGTTTGTCDPLPSNGQPCDAMDMFCDLSQELLLCNPYTTVCAAPGGTVPPDQLCGYRDSVSPYLACDGLCIINTGGNAGTCFSSLPEGQACTSADFCSFNLKCSGGVCVPIGPTTCNGAPADAGWSPVDGGSTAPDARD